MSEDRTRIAVNIYGNQYKIMASGETSEAYIKRIATEVNEQMMQIARHNPRLDAQRIAVLAAVNIVDQNIRLQSEMEPMHRAKVQGEKHAERLQQLSKELEQARADKDQALDNLRESLEAEAALQREAAVAEALRHKEASEAETAKLKLEEVRSQWEREMNAERQKHQTELASERAKHQAELAALLESIEAKLAAEHDKHQSELADERESMESKLASERESWRERSEEVASRLLAERDEALAQLASLQQVAAAASAGDRQMEQELERVVEDYRRLQELYDSRQAEFQREQEQWEAAFLKVRSSEAESPELEQLREEHRKLQDEYAKLQTEYNEWVELVISNDDK